MEFGDPRPAAEVASGRVIPSKRDSWFDNDDHDLSNLDFQRMEVHSLAAHAPLVTGTRNAIET